MRGVAAKIAAAAGSASLLGALVSATPSAAQQWHAEAHGGQLRFDLGPATAVTSTFMTGIRYDAPGRWARVSAGIPIGSEDPLWGAAGAATRLNVPVPGGVRVGVDLTGHGFVQSDRGAAGDEDGDLPGPPIPVPVPVPIPGPGDSPGGGISGWGLAAEILPLVSLQRYPVGLEARIGPSHYRSGFEGLDERRRTVWITDARASWSPRPGGAVVAEVRRFGAEEDAYLYAGGVVVLASTAGEMRAGAGHWLDRGGVDVDPFVWSLGGALALGQRAALLASGRRDALDPVYGSIPRVSWSVGVSYRFGGVPPAPPPPLPARYAEGHATIVLRGRDARVGSAAAAADDDAEAGGQRAGESAVHPPGTPRIAGDFTDWEPRPMTRSGADWSFTVALEPGVYNYAFVTEDGEWYVPESVPGRKDDGMGGFVAVLVVR